MNNNSYQITILVGCPGAGKSTWASKQNFDIILNDDELFDQYPEIPEREMPRKIDSILLDILKSSDKGLNICIDAFTLLYVDIACLAMKYNAKIVYINTPLNICLYQNNKRDRHVPEKLIRLSYIILQNNKTDFKEKLKDKFIEVAA